MKKHFLQQHADVAVNLRCQKCDFDASDVKAAADLKSAAAVEEHCPLKSIKAIEEHAKAHGDPPTACRLCQFSAHHGPTMAAHFETAHETRDAIQFTPGSFQITPQSGYFIPTNRGVSLSSEGACFSTIQGV